MTTKVQQGLQPVPGVKKIIAIASGKGGVGKSTTTVNIALALQAEGKRVGILDADIYGPNQPHMLGVANAKPDSHDGKHLLPVMSHGLQAMSIGFLIDMQTPMIWRGPMVTTALQQLLYDTQWDNLDYLLIDLPPGTGDVQLTMAQKIPVNGALIVTTPQPVALLDAYKAIAMFDKVKVPILGVVENMSAHVCSHCGQEEAIFASGGGQRLAIDANTELLGNVPLALSIRLQTDEGKPTVIAEPDSALANIYRDIARKIMMKLAAQPVDHSLKFPRIVIKTDS